MSNIRDQIISRLSENEDTITNSKKGSQSRLVKSGVGGKVDGVLNGKQKELSAGILGKYISGIALKNRLSQIAPEEATFFVFKTLLEENIKITKDVMPLIRELFDISGAQQFTLLTRAKDEFLSPIIEEADIVTDFGALAMPESDDISGDSLIDAKLEEKSKVSKKMIEKVNKKNHRKVIKDIHKQKEEKKNERILIKDREDKLKIIKAFRRKLLTKINNDEWALKNTNKEKLPRKLKKKLKNIESAEIKSDAKQTETAIVNADTIKQVKTAKNPFSIREVNICKYEEFAVIIEKKIGQLKEKIAHVKNPVKRKTLEDALCKLNQRLFILKSLYKPLKSLKDKLRALSVKISKAI